METTIVQLICVDGAHLLAESEKELSGMVGLSDSDKRWTGTASYQFAWRCSNC